VPPVTANIGNAARATQSHDIDLSLESAWEFRSPFEPGRTRVLSSCGGEVLKLLDRKAAGASRSERRDLDSRQRHPCVAVHFPRSRVGFGWPPRASGRRASCSALAAIRPGCDSDRYIKSVIRADVSAAPTKKGEFKKGEFYEDAFSMHRYHCDAGRHRAGARFHVKGPNHPRA